MRVRHFATRRELEEHHFPWLVLIGIPLLMLLLAAYLPKLFPASALVDLPLLVVIFFSLSQRSAIGGTFMGSCRTRSATSTSASTALQKRWSASRRPRLG